MPKSLFVSENCSYQKKTHISILLVVKVVIVRFAWRYDTFLRQATEAHSASYVVSVCRDRFYECIYQGVICGRIWNFRGKCFF